MSQLLETRPKGLLRWALHAPRWLYHSGLGWILGDRFLLLHYIGRKSGKPRETIIEVVDHDRASDTYFVASGWGTKSDWFQSIRANPGVRIQVGRRTIEADVHILDLDEAAKRLAGYAKNHRTAFHELSLLLTGKALKGTDQECRDLAHTVPVIAFRPKQS